MADVGPNSRRKRSESVRHPAPFLGIATLSKVGAEPSDSSRDVLLPCLDEAAALPWVLSRMPAGFQPIVIDNGSRDGSPEIAAALGAIVIKAERRGYGAACHAGLLAATAPIVAVMDADASLDPNQLPELVVPLLRDEADLVVGARRLVHPRSQSWPLRLANIEVARRLRHRTGLTLRDLGPMRAARRVPLLGLDLQDRRSGYPAETVVRAADAGWRVLAVDVDYLERRGHSKVTGTPIGAWRAVRDMTAAMALRSR
jgi:glycosyltransferase involved in cell wall biosynthesis